VEAFYQSHRDRFIAPEKRTARNILITVNSAYQENTREVALGRIYSLAATLKCDTEQFAWLAQLKTCVTTHNMVEARPLKGQKDMV